MKRRSALLTALTCASLTSLQAQSPGPGAPESNGLTPKTATTYVNPIGTVSNDKTESLGVSIAANGNVIVGWEDDKSDTAPDVNDFEAVWTLFNSAGAPLLPEVDMRADSLAGATVKTRFYSYFRKDNSPVPGITSWGPKIKANLFGDGIGMGATSYALGDEVPEFAAIQLDAGGGADFPSVQLLNNSGQAAGIVSGMSDAQAESAGNVRIGDWEYLANGNIVIAGESRQNADLETLFGGAAGKHAVFRIVDSKNVEIKGLSLASEVAEPNEMWHGVGVTKNGFALRFPQNSTTIVRLFNNDGTAASTNINLAELTGKPAAGAGGRGDNGGFHGNGNDAYVYAAVGTDENGVKMPWVTVLNANGTVRFSRAVADDVEVTNPGGADAAITGDGRVLVVFDDPYAAGGRVVLGRLFDKTGQPLGGTFYVSEKEQPGVSATSEKPRVACRGEQAAVVWTSHNNPDGIGEVAMRLFSVSSVASSGPGAPEANGLTPKTATTYVNPVGTVSNDNTESLGVGIAANGNVIVGWEDDKSDTAPDVNDFESVWTLFSPSGSPLLPEVDMRADSLAGATVKTRFYSYFRTDNSPVPGITSWGPKIKANLFGDGLGMGATSYALGDEVPEFAAIQVDAGGGADFPSVQLLNNNGQAAGIVSGMNDAQAETAGNVRIGDWEFLSNGNIVIAGESRQNEDLETKFGGAAPGKHAVFRVVDSKNVEIKGLSLASEVAEPNEMWHGVGVTKNGFALRFPQNSSTTIRLFNNDGTPASTNINLGELTGKSGAGAGGRGDNSGFHGNGNDAYVYAAVGTDENGVKMPWVTVLNADGTVRFSRAVADDVEVTNPGGADAAITSDGRVLVVFDDPYAAGGRVVLGRLFDKTGQPLGGTFYVSEKEQPGVSATSEKPRVAWRGEQAAVVWTSHNNPDGIGEVAMRLFSTTAVVGGQPTLSISHSGNNVTISWTEDGATLESNTKVGSGTWSTVLTTGKSYTTPATGGSTFYRLKK